MLLLLLSISAVSAVDTSIQHRHSLLDPSDSPSDGEVKINFVEVCKISCHHGSCDDGKRRPGALLVCV